MALESHSASTTLDDIINELKLSYDSSNGTLDGDSMKNVPNYNILQNMDKLFNNILKELSDVEKTDDEVLKRINTLLEKNNQKAEGDDDAPSNKADDEGEDTINDGSPTKRRKLHRKLSETQYGKQDVDIRHPEDTDNENNPPIQTGSFTHEHDTRLKNPKSEFVPSQSLSTEAINELGLYSEDNHGLETHGKEYLKRKYGVASYPEVDLKKYLPGEIPNTDFSRNKPPTNQVQFTTFQSYIESYFRLFLNEDIKFLKENYVIPPGFDKLNYDPNVTPYIIPKLGTFYAEEWAESDAALGSKIIFPQNNQTTLDSYKAKGSIENLNEDNLYTEEVSCGPLSSRLLSAILSNDEGLKDDEEEDDDNVSNPLDDDVATRLNANEYRLTTEVNDFHSIEERLKRELKYIGIFMNLPKMDQESKNNFKIDDYTRNNSIVDSDEWIKNREDDEVCAEIRSLQKELKEASGRNRKYKKKLFPIVEEQIAWQEYSTVLEDLDKQVDQAYQKRLKSRNRKKKLDTPIFQQQTTNSGLRLLLEKRLRWIKTIGRLFKDPDTMRRIPEVPVFPDNGDNEDEGEDEVNIDTDDAIIQK